MPITQAQFSNLLSPILRKAFYEKEKTAETEFDKIFKIQTTERYQEKDYDVIGLPMASVKAEGGNITYNDPLSGYLKTYTPTGYGIGFRVTWEMYNNDLYNVMKKISRSLYQSMMWKADSVAFNVFNNAFTVTTGNMDSTYLCSTAHPLVPGGTASNRPTTGSDLSPTSLKAGMQHFDNLDNDYGYPVYVKPKTLLVSPSDRYTAMEILKTVDVPYSADNTINVMHNELEIKVGHWLTDTDAWFLLADKADECFQLNFLWRLKPTFESSDDFDSGDAKFKSFMMLDVGASGWRFIYGNPGI